MSSFRKYVTKRPSSALRTSPHPPLASPPRLTVIGRLILRQADELHGRVVPQGLVPHVEVEGRDLLGSTRTAQELLVGGHAQVVVAKGLRVMDGRPVDPAGAPHWSEEAKLLAVEAHRLLLLPGRSPSNHIHTADM